MDIDDSPERVRRNILLLSFTIIASSFLNLNFEQQGKLFNVINYSQLSPFRFWVILTIVLTYLFLRYWFDKSRKEDITLLKEDYEITKQTLIRFFLNREIRKSILKKQQPKWIVDYKELTETTLKSYYEERGLPTKVKSSINLEKDKIKNWNGWIGTDYEVEWKNKGFYTKTGGFRYQYILSNTPIFIITTLSLLKITTYSKTNVDFFVPVVLSAIALGICITEIACKF